MFIIKVVGRQSRLEKASSGLNSGALNRPWSVQLLNMGEALEKMPPSVAEQASP